MPIVIASSALAASTLALAASPAELAALSAELPASTAKLPASTAELPTSTTHLAASNPAPAASTPAPGDAEAGARIYSRCEACHALAYDRTGPRHCGLIGRRAGSVPGFPYSDAMKRSGLVWTAATLDRFLADPMKAVPGTTMGYAGVKDPKERADLIAFLLEHSAGPECREK